jgi:hypothetical protein
LRLFTLRKPIKNVDVGEEARNVGVEIESWLPRRSRLAPLSIRRQETSSLGSSPLQQITKKSKFGRYGAVTTTTKTNT